ncbi:MAG: aspartate-semialdehyde dehydrogenase [Candidatus Dormibacteria bacterium]
MIEPHRYSVGILGATGLVGQQLVQLLQGHPWFELRALAASERSAGRVYADAVSWRMEAPLPPAVAAMAVQPLRPELDCDLVFSALDAAVAGEAEEAFARAGYPVISNAGAHRMDDDVPLLIPEINPSHLEAIPEQQRRRGYAGGYLVTNPNCSATGLAMALKPLQDAFGVFAATVVTMQAISGAGLDQLAASAVQDNLIPFIRAEEPKLEREPLKILGGWHGGRFSPADMVLSASCNRVPVLYGHTESVSVRLGSDATAERITAAMAGFHGLPQELRLPSAPPQPLVVSQDQERPQPRLDRNAGRGMAVSVGRVRPCPVLGWKFSLVVHNAVRGAAGAALLNAELLAAQERLPVRRSAGT